MAHPNNPKMQGHAQEIQAHVDAHSGLAHTASDQAPQKHPQEKSKGEWAQDHQQGPVNVGPATGAGSPSGPPGAGGMSSGDCSSGSGSGSGS